MRSRFEPRSPAKLKPQPPRRAASPFPRGSLDTRGLRPRNTAASYSHPALPSRPSGNAKSRGCRRSASGRTCFTCGPDGAPSAKAAARAPPASTQAARPRGPAETIARGPSPKQARRAELPELPDPGPAPSPSMLSASARKFFRHQGAHLGRGARRGAREGPWGRGLEAQRPRGIPQCPNQIGSLSGPQDPSMTTYWFAKPQCCLPPLGNLP